MANTRDLRRRIRSIKNTSQITKAMQMVSATKMRRAQNQALFGRPYQDTLSSALSLIFTEELPNNKLLMPNGSLKVAVLLLTSDKGLCGGLNTNLFRFMLQSGKLKGKDLTFYTIGRKGRDFVVRTRQNLEADFENDERVEFIEAVKLREFIILELSQNKVGQVYLLYPKFISTLKQEPTLVQLLPIDLEVNKNENSESEKSQGQFLFEPNQTELLDYALTHLVDTQIYQALLETKASEHSARMIAMKNATDNALELVGEITLAYNQARQENITNELLEITTATAALE